MYKNATHWMPVPRDTDDGKPCPADGPLTFNLSMPGKEVPATDRQEQLSDLMYLRLFPLRRLYRERIEAMYREPDPVLFDEGEYAEQADALIRVTRLIDRIAARLPPLPVAEEDVLSADAAA
ncbi:MAG: hypothetical protein ACRDYC_10375 [Acidimicrobiales bacterium]